MESPSHVGEPGLSEPVAGEGRLRHRLIGKSAQVQISTAQKEARLRDRAYYAGRRGLGMP